MMPPSKFRVLAFTVKPLESPDSRYRILQYAEWARQDGMELDHRSLMGPAYYRWQRAKTHLLLRMVLYPILLAIRFWQVLYLAPQYDAVWISREMTPLGPPILEELLVKRCKRVVFDVDDAMHLPHPEFSKFIAGFLRNHNKFAQMAARYTAIVCGNQYLADYYSQFSANVFVIPTVVDVERYAQVQPTPANKVRIGWIGTPTNRYHLNLLQNAFSRLAQERDFELVLVGLNEPLEWSAPFVRYIQWTLRNELTFFSQFDIGIMPLVDSPFARGKCAFKLIQYMAAGLPVVASPVGANCDLVLPGRNGFLAADDDEWQARLRLLVDDSELRRGLGQNGRELVRRSYSAQAMWPRYAAILSGVQQSQTVCAG